MKKIVSLILVFCLLATALLSCGKEPADSKGDPDTSDTTGGSDTSGGQESRWCDYGTTVLEPLGTTKGSFDRTKFHIGVYCFETKTEEMIKALHDCGIDFIASDNATREVLDLYQQYGIGVFISGVVNGWWGAEGQNAGTFEASHPLSDYEAAAASFVDHPVIWGIDVGDEPNLKDFPHFGRVVDKIDELFPNQFPYLNLYPAYASGMQLGGSYQGYIDAYVRDVDTDYICYDCYSGGLGWYESLSAVAQACTDSGRSLWVVMRGYGGATDGSQYGHAPVITLNEMRVQAYTAMAFGAELINWACWEKGWGSSFPVEEGKLTETYDTWSAVNHEILGIADTYMLYRHVSTTLLGFEPGTWQGRDATGLSMKPVSVMSAGVFKDLRIDGTDRNFVIGERAPRNGDGSSALMISNATSFDGGDKTPVDLTFTTVDSRTVKAYQGDSVIELVPDENGTYRLTVDPYAGILLVAERK